MMSHALLNTVLTPEISMCEVVRPGLSKDLEGSLAGRLVRIVRYLDQETVHHPDSLKPSGPYPTPERALILPVQVAAAHADVPLCACSRLVPSVVLGASFCFRTVEVLPLARPGSAGVAYK
jgi:hypothetical protein